MTASGQSKSIVIPTADLWLNVDTVSEANTASSEHWKHRHARSKSQICDVVLLMRSQFEKWKHVRLPLSIVLERHSASQKPLDDDNLPSSLKHVQDGIADALGLYLPPGEGPRKMSARRTSRNQHFDDSDRLSWSYRQVLCAAKPGVSVRLYKAGTMARKLESLLDEKEYEALRAWVQASFADLDRMLP